MDHLYLTKMKERNKKMLIILRLSMSQTNKRVFQLSSQELKNVKYVFNNSHYDNFEVEIIDTTQKSAT